MKYLNRWVIDAALVIALVLIGLPLWAAWQLGSEPAPLRYPSEPVQPAKVEVCPGELLEADYTVAFGGKQTIAMRVESVWNTETQRTVLYDAAPDYYVTPRVSGQNQIHFEWTVPALPRGHYLFLRGVSGFPASDLALLSVPFTIKVDCP